MTTPTRNASCRCGQIRIVCTGFVADYSVYEDHMEPWVPITGEAIEHYD